MTLRSVAVVIPSYNHGRYLAATLDSVFNQSLPPQELHVLDDGSTDNSVQVIERAFEEYSGPIRCRLSVRDNRGISATRNELFAATTTDSVAFLDSDDLYAAQRLERLLAAAPPDGPWFAFSGVEFLCEGDAGTAPNALADWHEVYRLKLGQGMSFPTAGFALLRSNIAISASNFVISRSLLDAAGGFDGRISICQDWDLAVAALEFVEPTFVPQPLLTYRIHAHNTSRDAGRTATAEIDLVFEKYCRWLLKPTVNPIAPTPRNWPHYFRIFAHLCTSAAGRPLASRLPAEALAMATAAGTAPTPVEATAIRSLIAASRSPEVFAAMPATDLMLRCHHAWAGSP
jgi:glycosyltransferase involved in cell wall biosynthesis